MNKLPNAFFLAALLPALITARLPGQVYSTASKSTAGVIGNGDSGDMHLTGDGRYAVFSSTASNLVAGDTNGLYDIYLRDTTLGTCERISLGAGSVEPDGDCRFPNISEDGRYVVFVSHATNLVAGDTNSSPDIFLVDRTAGTIERTSLTWLGLQSATGLYQGRICDVSDDGRYVAWHTTSDDLVTTFTGGATRDVYVRDRTAGTTTLVSIATGGTQSSGGWDPTLSADGSVVAFTSNGHLLHPFDTDSNDDIFAWTMATAGIEIVSVTPAGTSGSSPGGSSKARITPDARYVVFESTCTDLDVDDVYGDRDVYLRDRTLGTTEAVSYHKDGTLPNYIGGENADVSADGRYVVWQGQGASTNAPAPIFGGHVYFRDLTAGTTELVTIPRWWMSSFQAGGGTAQVSDDGTTVMFGNQTGGTPEEGGTIYSQLMLRERDGVSNTMSLISYNGAGPGYSLTISGYDAPAGATWYFAWSGAATGSSLSGHAFDLARPANVAGSGTAAADGSVSYTNPPIPSTASGKTVYLELAANSGGTWFDSNYVKFEVY